jgi:glycosyltransferase involved in cell wall biosynthesis
MNVLYMVDHWPSLFATYVLREISWMKSRGHRVSVISLGSGGALGFREETNRQVDLSEFGLEKLPVLQLEVKQMSNHQMISESLRFIRQQEAQMIDAHFAREPAELAYRIYLNSGIPYAVRMRGGDTHSKISAVLAQIVEHASAVCPMSQFLADVLTGKRVLAKTPDGLPIDVSSGKLRVLPNSLPASYLAGHAAEQSDDIQVVGSIGRVVPIKRFQDIIKAVGELAGDFPGLRLLIIGGGVMTGELLELAEQVGISERFEITGFKNWDEAMRLATRLHIYVQASELEGCSLATIEAAFKGIPLVLSRTGANEESVEPGVNGYLFDACDVGAIGESLKSLLLAGAKRRQEMGASTLKIASQRFTAENLLPGIEAIFQAVINGNALPEVA